MKVIYPKINESLSRLKAQLNENSLNKKFANGEAPMRSELFSADQMEQHGKILASTHTLVSETQPDQNLLKRLAENEDFLFEVHDLLTETVKAKRAITPAGEWLLDNFYLIEDQIRTGKKHLPKGYSRELPRLLKGSSKGLPRVYDIAQEVISHGDGRVDPENLNRFVAAYQTVTTLKIGELWAIPIMLRLALIENLRRVAVRVAAGRIERNLADYWADKMIEIVEQDPKSLILVVADMARSNPPMTTPFVSEITRKLQGLSHILASPLTWIEQHLSDSGQTIEQLIQIGNQQQAADQVSISNCIGSHRFLDSMDWPKFVETMSSVEGILMKDPCGVYGQMDFTSRDRYRHVIEKISKNSSQSEEEVAQFAIGLSQEGAALNGAADRTAHVGYYLIDKGSKKLEALAKVKFSAASTLRKISKRVPLLLYNGSIILLTAIITAGLLDKVYEGGLNGLPLTLMGILIFLAASSLSIALVNWLSTLMVLPKRLPRMDYSEGIPPELRTLVVIPAILINAKNINKLVEFLEVRYLANRDKNLHFGLLTDFQDADKETLPEDEPLVQLVHEKIEKLNEKYKEANSDTFFLFHRPRQWNSRERLWMGYERKRGKLEELNSLLRGGSKNRFSLIIGNTEVLPFVKYVITLDSDTQLPRDSARHLVGTMAHPLNRPHYNEKKHCVTDGYTILQPRVAISLPETNRSRYARLYGSEPGIDPYTRTVSDVYQDVFGEGSFIGKGIYDVDMFERVLNGRFPENQILSHDLIEGCYTRSGLLSDVQLYEEYPSRYITDVNRRHRWIRGDWQLLKWLLPVVPGPNRGLFRNTLSFLSLWKIFDNIRRSLVPAAIILILLLGWTVLSQPLFWTVVVIGIIIIPSSIISIIDLLNKPKDVLIRQHLVVAIRSTGVHFAQAAFTFATLPYEAFFSQDAIIRTLWRMLISHKKLLEWNPSNVIDRNSKTNLLSSFRTMWIGPVIAVSTIIYFVYSEQVIPFIALPILFIWAVSPAISWWISLPLIQRKAKLTIAQKLFLREVSRKTWSFFETFVGPEDNWLPPDNYQEDPGAAIAHRTSPTNMGLALLANLSAYDFGFINIGQLIDRTSNAFKTMETLERYRGHFFNWYDTQSLKPLPPLYISSVDSGNISGHLLTLSQGFLSLPDKKIVGQQQFEGISDTLRIFIDAAGEIKKEKLVQLQRDLELMMSSPSIDLIDVSRRLNKLAAASEEIENNFIEKHDGESRRWAHALALQCKSTLDELIYHAPWVNLPNFPDLENYVSGINEVPSLRKLAQLDVQLLSDFKNLSDHTPEKIGQLDKLQKFITEASVRANKRITQITDLAKQSNQLANMDYTFLYDKTSHLQSVGYSVNERRRDSSYYDLLASEARLSSFVAIAQGALPQESWFALGRLLTTVGGEPILLSWSGSMFEYLMPLLVMPTYESTLLDQTYKAAVKKQIEYGKERGVPWGISESGYNTVDVNLNYQYRAFGVPGLGLKRGLAEDLVIAPYASALALMVEPEAACLNLQRLAADGILGKYGFFEAVDYTKSRVPRGQSSVTIKSFMAHHSGMTLLSLAYLILDRPMQKRFNSNPLFEATILLLQERIPKATVFYSHASGLTDTPTQFSSPGVPVRILNNPGTPVPEVHLLSNGKYHVMITNAGGGYGRWKDIAVTRWREDTTRDNWGTFCYIHDESSGEFWSTTHQPTLKRSKNYEAIFSEGLAEFRRQDQNFDMHTEIVVSPEDDIELRRIHLTNRSRTQRTIDITSYAEVVLAESATDNLHPAFSNLFVQTEIIQERHAIICHRRPRSMDEKIPFMFHMMEVRGVDIEKVSFETDRMQFIGRGNTTAHPQVMNNFTSLSGSQGSVLDPIVAIRYKIILEPEETATVDMILGISETREAVLVLIDKYHDRRLANRIFELAWTHSQVTLRQINATEVDAQLYGRIASSIIFGNASLRTDPSVIIKNRRGQSGLWGYSISGDLPIVLLQIESPDNINIVRRLVQAHSYWRLKGLSVDLVIWNEDHAGYRQLLQEQIMSLISAGIEANFIDRPGGIFVRQADQISNEDRILFQTVARVIISDQRGTLEEQINQVRIVKASVRRFKPTRNYHLHNHDDLVLPRNDLTFFNGLGGFTPDGREYIITTSQKQVTPAPWVNVIANAEFGTIVSENGPSYTWSENAHEFRLTPWNNDPVTDSSSEAFYIRDEETGHYWSPTPLPSRGIGAYASRHGFGYSVFEHTENGIHSELWIYVATDAAIKFSVLKLRNESGSSRKLSVTGYVELVMGDLHSKSGMHITTKVDQSSAAIFAQNPYNSEFVDRVVFFQTDSTTRTVTGDRNEFIGRNCSLRNPDAMTRSHLSGKTGAALDPCAAIQIPFELDDNQEQEIIFKLGSGKNENDAINLLHRFKGSTATRTALESVWNYWRRTLDAVQIETPDTSLNILTNGWLLYQTLACRIWARSGYYQSGGAFGFRDQLQDVMSLIYTEPNITRQHLLLCASRQFQEGDVQHWWHPPSGRGVRTHCSDDYLWLPLAVCRYVLSTGDTGVLDESVYFLEGRTVNPEDDSYYDLPNRSEESASLYQHCVQAIINGLKFGGHGLPLIGSGDWNDGMNMIGIHGKGESVWLGFFLYEVLTQFIKIAGQRGDIQFVERCKSEAHKLQNNIEQNGWDGEWYRRAYFDDGSPLGSSSNQECKIDSIAQSWSVLSGAGDSKRSRIAMESLDKNLVRRDHKLIQLLDPPFDKSNLNPGYIKGYVPGVRENGGQYTHAAIWAAMAFAELGDSKRAWELLAIINPINHAKTPEEIATFKVEPYVVAADIYALTPHIGRGGWTWYTGSAGWMYRLIVESLLGLKLEVDKLHLNPCIPADWETYKMHYRYRETFYHISVFQTHENNADLSITVDGVQNVEKIIPLVDDRQEHNVEVRITLLK
ncbi:MAG TPA: cyclic beta 1-2 glucan synthetase [Ignavibacteriales bacterium]|nr:cyclic beta 1-2 glucan synthetase [Ignavibacteriales bacterium]